MSDERFHAAPISQAGRKVVGRLLPGADLMGGLEAVCDRYDIRYAAVVFAYGSLSRASFKILQKPSDGSDAVLVGTEIGRRVEFMGGQGLVCRDKAGGRATHLHGSVSDESGTVQGGHFNPGENPIYNNLDFLLEELLDVELIRAHDPDTDTVEMRVRSELGA
jgi:predicted DNA-binding protein with PD1-like motif